MRKLSAWQRAGLYRSIIKDPFRKVVGDYLSFVFVSNGYEK
jgi:hypothetical protein